jgi:peptidoglycan/LPS O-acetylase OafA/YrhL
MLPAAFALLVAATGWYYLFQVRVPVDPGDEQGRLFNLRRYRLRRLGGLMMLALGVLIFAGFFAVDQTQPTRAFFLIWLSVCILVVAVLMLALVDIRLTWKMRQLQRHCNP